MKSKKSLLTTTLVSFGLLFSSATITLASTTSFDVDVEVYCSDESTAAIAPEIDYPESNNVVPVIDSDTNLPTGLNTISLDVSIPQSATLKIDLNSESDIDCKDGVTPRSITIGYTDDLATEVYDAGTNDGFISDSCGGTCYTADPIPLNDYVEVYFNPDAWDEGKELSGGITVTLLTSP
jgi:hypothetical protein